MQVKMNMDNKCELKKGILKKQNRGSSFFKNWKTRLCVIESGKLSYYETEIEEYPYGANLKGTMSFKNAVIITDNKKEKHKIFIKGGISGEDDLILDAETEANAQEWIKAIKKHIDFANGKYDFILKKQQELNQEKEKEGDDNNNNNSNDIQWTDNPSSSSKQRETLNNRTSAITSSTSKSSKPPSTTNSASTSPSRLPPPPPALRPNTTTDNNPVPSSTSQINRLSPERPQSINRITPPARLNVESSINTNASSTSTKAYSVFIPKVTLCQVCFLKIDESINNGDDNDDSGDVTANFKFCLFNSSFHSNCIRCNDVTNCDCRQISYYFKCTKSEEREDWYQFCGHFVDYLSAEQIQKVYRGYKVRKFYSKMRQKIIFNLNAEIQKKLRMKAAASAAASATSRKQSVDMDQMTFNIYREFSEFSKKQLESYTALFELYDVSGTGKINLEGFKKMMEKLGLPQTHLKLKELMREVDDDKDNMINLRDFLILFRKRRKGELLSSSFTDIVNLFESSIDVSETGVKDATKYFESRAKLININDIVTQEVKKEAELNKIKKVEKMKRKEEFAAKRSAVGDFLKRAGGIPLPVAPIINVVNNTTSTTSPTTEEQILTSSVESLTVAPPVNTPPPPPPPPSVSRPPPPPPPK